MTTKPCSTNTLPASVAIQISSYLNTKDKIKLASANKKVRLMILPTLLSNPLIRSVESLTTFLKFLEGMRVDKSSSSQKAVNNTPSNSVESLSSLAKSQTDPRALAITHFDCSRLVGQEKYSACINNKFLMILFEVCPNLEYLNIVGASIDLVIISLLPKFCPKLKFLNISECLSVRAWERSIQSLTHLEYLGVAKLSFNATHLLDAIKNLPKLKMIDCSGANFTVMPTYNQGYLSNYKLLFPQKLSRVSQKEFHKILHPSYDPATRKRWT